MPQMNDSANSAAIQALIPELRTVARKLVDGSAHAPDGLVHDALVLALRNWHRLPPAVDLKPWLLGMLSERARAIGDRGLVERARQLGMPVEERD
jgi:DNA-directed RNA polymerase specialized sigma24 family protein